MTWWASGHRDITTRQLYTKHTIYILYKKQFFKSLSTPYWTCANTPRHRCRQAGAQTERIKQNQVQLTPFTTVDIPLTVRGLKQLRRATPGGAFDVYPPFLPRQEGAALTKRVQNSVFSKPVESPSDKISSGRQRPADGTEEGGNGGALLGVFFSSSTVSPWRCDIFAPRPPTIGLDHDFVMSCRQQGVWTISGSLADSSWLGCNQTKAAGFSPSRWWVRLRLS